MSACVLGTLALVAAFLLLIGGVAALDAWTAGGSPDEEDEAQAAKRWGGEHGNS